MATKISGSFDLTGQSLISALKKRAGKREGDSKFIGLQRSLALSDVKDPTKSLNNVLDKISLLLSAERNQYNSVFNATDWDVTRDFINEGIDREFLSRLTNASIGGGSLGSTVSITPRIRVQDRLNFLNSFYGEGSFAGLHNGPDAQFYRVLEPLHIGFIRFSFDDSTGVMTVTDIKGPNGITNITAPELLGLESRIVFDLSQYTFSGLDIDLGGLGISIKLESPSTWSVEDSISLKNLKDIQSIIDVDVPFTALRFKLIRPYSLLNVPKWFSESPSVSDETVAGSADDLNPTTSFRVLDNNNGTIVPFVQKGYWYSRGYVESRWSSEEQTSIAGLTGNPVNIVEDSNMRWQEPPTKLRAETFNWGIRWDGYLQITPGIYAFEVQTNVKVKIDIAIASGGGWSNVFDTSSAPKQADDLYLSPSTFDTSTIDNRYKYLTGDDPATDWVAYVPVTIRMYHGGFDKAEPTKIPPSEPNLFIKTASLTAPVNFYSADIPITFTDGTWTASDPNSFALLETLEQDLLASVSISLTARGTEILAPPIPVITELPLDLQEGIYTLTIRPLRPISFDGSLVSLWKSRIASPSSTHKNYADLTDGSYTPDMRKVAFDERPEWWKVSQGEAYNRLQPPSVTNNPLDGLVKNVFKDVLQSDAPGIGLYGNGAATPTYSTRPNLIMGEARYDTTQPLGANYVGLRLSPNLLGEGGRFDINAIPINDAVFSDSGLLGQNDLGGGLNYLTFAGDKLTPGVIQLFLWTNPTTPTPTAFNKFFIRSSLINITSSDDPTVYGLPAFSGNEWLSPLAITTVKLADNAGLTTNVRNFVAPLVLTAEKITINGFDLLAFSTTLSSILNGGAEAALFTGKFIQFYGDRDLAFQFSRVDTGQSLSFGDVLKFTYDNGVFQAATSEVPRPPSDRITPFGFDKPQFSSGLCYPPYAIGSPLLENIAIEDTDLYAAPLGNYDVFWGDPNKPGLGGKTLTITEKIEFQSADSTGIELLTSPPVVLYSQYTHRLKIDSPLQGSFDEDMLEHIGNGEKVKESYYTYIELA